jgi:hypothetical protein
MAGSMYFCTKNQKSVLTKNTLSSRAQINSSFLIPHLRNSDTTMSQLEVLGSAKARKATTVARVQFEPDPAHNNAETTTDMVVEEEGLPRNSEEGDDDLIDEELIDYNEDGTADAVEAAAKADRVKNLRETFASQGKEYRTLLKSEKVKDLFTSNMTVEMSAEDVLSETLKEELHNVGVVKGLLIMPPGLYEIFLVFTRIECVLSSSVCFWTLELSVEL